MKKELTGYIGPTFDRYGLKKGAVYNGGYPSHIEKIIEEYPSIKGLFVKIDEDYADKKVRVGTKGTPENALYNSLLKTLGGTNVI